MADTLAPEDLRQMTPDQLQEKLLKLKDEAMKLRFRQATGQLEKTHRMRDVRRDIARIKTVLATKAAQVAAAAS